MAKSSASRISASKSLKTPTPARVAKHNANRVEFELAHGGLISRTHMAHEPGELPEPKLAVHASMDDAGAHLKKSLGHAFPED